MAQTASVELDAQYRQLREECGVVDRSGRGKLLVTGAEAVEYLQGQLTNDIEVLGPGEGCYAALLDRKGHMQADMRVLNCSAVPLLRMPRKRNSGADGSGHTTGSAVPSPRIEGERNSGTGDGQVLWLDTEPEGLAAASRHLQMYKIGRDVAVEDVTGEWGLLSLIGPRSAEIAGAAPLPENASESVSLDGVGAVAVGTALGIDLIAAAAERERLIAALETAGAPAVTLAAAEVLRIETGVPRFGAEMDTSTMPAEAGIVARAVDFEKGCYIGQETVARLHYKGKPNRHLRGLRLSAIAAPGTPLWLGEKEVGKLGGSCLSPVHGPIGLAIVRREAEPGAELRLGEDGVTARVVDLPFG